MRLQRLLLSDTCGFQLADDHYSAVGVANGRRKFAEDYLAGNIACKRILFIEQLSSKLTSGHNRAPVPALLFSTKAVVDSLITSLFRVYVTNEGFDTHLTAVKAWLRVGGSPSDAVRGYDPLIIVREHVALTRLDTFMAPTIAQVEQQHHG